MFSPKRETIGGLAGAFEKHRELVDPIKGLGPLPRCSDQLQPKSFHLALR